jgi:WD40 repeat protein
MFVCYPESYLWSGSVDQTIRVWEVGSGKCLGVLSGAAGGSGHKDAISCLEIIPAVAPSMDAYIASGGGEGDVKLWKTNGEFVHSCSHRSFITALRVFQDIMGGIQVLLIGLLDGGIAVRSCGSMNILFFLDSSICHTKAVWSIANLGQSCFATGGDDGNLIVWRIEHALVDN